MYKTTVTELQLGQWIFTLIQLPVTMTTTTSLQYINQG